MNVAPARPEYGLTVTDSEKVGNTPLLSNVLEIFRKLSAGEDADGVQKISGLSRSFDAEVASEISDGANMQKLDDVLSLLEQNGNMDYMLRIYGFSVAGIDFESVNRRDLVKALVYLMAYKYDQSDKLTSKGEFGIKFSRPKLFLNLALLLAGEIDSTLVMRGLTNEGNGPALHAARMSGGTFANNSKLLKEVFSAPRTMTPAVQWTPDEEAELQKAYFAASKAGNVTMANREAIATAFGITSENVVKGQFSGGGGTLVFPTFVDKRDLFRKVLNEFWFEDPDDQDKIEVLAEGGNEWAECLIRIAEGASWRGVDDNEFGNRLIGEFSVRVFDRYGVQAIAREDPGEVLEALMSEFAQKEDHSDLYRFRARLKHMKFYDNDLEEEGFIDNATLWRYRLLRRGIASSLRDDFIGIKDVESLKKESITRYPAVLARLRQIIPEDLHSRFEKFIELFAGEELSFPLSAKWLNEFVLRLEHYLCTEEFLDSKGAFDLEKRVNADFESNSELLERLNTLHRKSRTVQHACVSSDPYKFLEEMYKGAYGPLVWIMDYLDNGVNSFDRTGFAEKFDEGRKADY